MKKLIVTVLLVLSIVSIPVSSFAATKYQKLNVRLGGRDVVAYNVGGVAYLPWTIMLNGYRVCYDRTDSLFYIPNRPTKSIVGCLVKSSRIKPIDYEFSRVMTDYYFYNVTTDLLEYADAAFNTNLSDSNNYYFILPVRGSFVKGTIINGNTYVAWNVFKDKMSVARYNGKLYFYYK
jgi:hypothetical protein